MQIAIDTNTDEDVTLNLRNGVLIVRAGVDPNAAAVIVADRKDLIPVLRGDTSWADAGFQIRGNRALGLNIWNYFDKTVFADHVSVP